MSHLRYGWTRHGCWLPGSCPTRWGGFAVRRWYRSTLTRRGPASREFRTDSAFRVWDGDALLRELFHVYEELPAETKAKIPLKQTWILDEDALL